MTAIASGNPDEKFTMPGCPPQSSCRARYRKGGFLRMTISAVTNARVPAGLEFGMW